MCVYTYLVSVPFRICSSRNSRSTTKNRAGSRDLVGKLENLGRLFIGRPQLAASNPRGSANGQRTPGLSALWEPVFRTRTTSGIFPSNFYRGPGQPNLRPGGHFLDPLPPPRFPLPAPLSPFRTCPSSPPLFLLLARPAFLIPRHHSAAHRCIVDRGRGRRRGRIVEKSVNGRVEGSSSSPLRCFTFAFDGESPSGGHTRLGGARGGRDVLQDLLERPFVLVSASRGGEGGGAVKYKLDLRER